MTNILPSKTILALLITSGFCIATNQLHCERDLQSESLNNTTIPFGSEIPYDSSQSEDSTIQESADSNAPPVESESQLGNSEETPLPQQGPDKPKSLLPEGDVAVPQNAAEAMCKVFLESYKFPLDDTAEEMKKVCPTVDTDFDKKLLEDIYKKILSGAQVPESSLTPEIKECLLNAIRDGKNIRYDKETQSFTVIKGSGAESALTLPPPKVPSVIIEEKKKTADELKKKKEEEDKLKLGDTF